MENTKEEPRVVSTVFTRYSDGYRVVRTLGATGLALNYAGAVIAALLSFGTGGVVLGINAIVEVPRELFLAAPILFALGQFVAIVTGTAMFLTGTLLAAFGQLLMADLDTAVSSSRFLSDRDCAQILTFPDVGAATVPPQIPIRSVAVGVRR